MTGPSIDEKEDVSAGRRRFARHVSGFTLATLASRVLGYLRDAGIAFCFGGGGLTDAYYAAFRIANFLRRTLGEGALNASFVPVLSHERQKGAAHARAFFSALWTALALLTAALVLVGIWQARPIVLALTYGFARDPGKLELTVTLTQLMFPHLFFVTAAALAQGALFATRRFFLPALAPTAFSISILAYLGLLWSGWLPLSGAREQIMGLAVAAVAGSALQWLIQLPMLRREGFTPAFRSPSSHPGVWQVMALMGPSLVTMATDQIDAFVDTVFASFLRDGSVTAIYNASRLMQLPLGLFGVATATVALTHLSEYASAGRMDRYRRTLSESLGLTAFVLFPASAGLMAISDAVVRLLFEHGAFTREASAMTNSALWYYCLGLVAYGWTKVLVIAHYAVKDAKTPVWISALKVVLNILFCLALVGPMEVGGLALAATLSSWICTGALLWTAARRAGLEPGFALAVAKPALASVLLYGAVRMLRIRLDTWGLGSDALVVSAAIGLAVPLYYALAAAFDMPERHAFLQLGRQKDRSGES